MKQLITKTLGLTALMAWAVPKASAVTVEDFFTAPDGVTNNVTNDASYPWTVDEINTDTSPFEGVPCAVCGINISLIPLLHQKKTCFRIKHSGKEEWVSKKSTFQSGHIK